MYHAYYHSYIILYWIDFVVFYFLFYLSIFIHSPTINSEHWNLSITFFYNATSILITNNWFFSWNINTLHQIAWNQSKIERFINVNRMKYISIELHWNVHANAFNNVIKLISLQFYISIGNITCRKKHHRHMKWPMAYKPSSVRLVHVFFNVSVQCVQHTSTHCVKITRIGYFTFIAFKTKSVRYYNIRLLNENSTVHSIV